VGFLPGRLITLPGKGYPVARYDCNGPAIIGGMEADRINLIENSLQDLAARAAELRRYL
jgi:hypothetical protein